jgi:hypothetical protein
MPTAVRVGAAGLALGLVCVFLLSAAAFVRGTSQTFDEAVHLAAGYSYLATGDPRLNRGHPPLSKLLAALPLRALHPAPPFEPDPALWASAADFRVGLEFLYGGPVPHRTMLLLGRAPGVAIGAALAVLVGWWARRLWGDAAGLVALAVAALDPNLVAHAGVITPDVSVALFVFLACYLAWEHAQCPSRSRLVAVGVATGCALASKNTALVLLPVLGIAFLAGNETPALSLRPVVRRALAATAAWLAVLAIALATLSLFYGVVDLPTWYEGIQTHFARPGAPNFLLGEIRKEGWWHYFAVAFAVKTPDGTLLLLLLSLIPLWRGGRFGRREWLYVALPAALYFAAMVAIRVNIGVRYLLPVYPFVFLLCGRVATFAGARAGRSVAWGAVVLGLLSLTAASSLRVAPNFLAHFNFAAGGPARGAQLLGDSNLDWGQDLARLRDFLAREGVPATYLSYFGSAPPAAYRVQAQYLPGFFDPLQQRTMDLLPENPEREWLAISVTNLQGIFLPDPETYAWLRSRDPIARIGYSIHVYDVTRDADAHRRLAAIYRRAGLARHAEREERRAAAIAAGGLNSGSPGA